MEGFRFGPFSRVRVKVNESAMDKICSEYNSGEDTSNILPYIRLNGGCIKRVEKGQT